MTHPTMDFAVFWDEHSGLLTTTWGHWRWQIQVVVQSCIWRVVLKEQTNCSEKLQCDTTSKLGFLEPVLWWNACIDEGKTRQLHLEDLLFCIRCCHQFVSPLFPHGAVSVAIATHGSTFFKEGLFNALAPTPPKKVGHDAQTQPFIRFQNFSCVCCKFVNCPRAKHLFVNITTAPRRCFQLAFCAWWSHGQRFCCCCFWFATPGTRNSKGSTRRRQLRISYVETGNDEYESKNQQQVKPRPATRRDRVHPESTDRIRHGRRAMASKEDGELKNANTKPALNVDTEEDEQRQTTPVLSSPRSPSSVRSSRDLRSPGAQKTPTAQAAKLQSNGQALPDFITQTDANGNATTPRSASGVQNARKSKPRRSNQRQGRKGRRRGSGSSDDEDRSDSPESGAEDPCDSLLDSIRLMCCCFGPDDARHAKIAEGETQDSEDRVKLLGKLHPDDEGKKCLVLDLDETLVHSSFRAVPGADFVIPVQVSFPFLMHFDAKQRLHYF